MGCCDDQQVAASPIASPFPEIAVAIEDPDIARGVAQTLSGHGYLPVGPFELLAIDELHRKEAIVAAIVATKRCVISDRSPLAALAAYLSREAWVYDGQFRRMNSDERIDNLPPPI